MSSHPVVEFHNKELARLSNSGFKQVGSTSKLISKVETSAQNRRFTEAWLEKPTFIIIPQNLSQLRQSVVSCVTNGWEIRVRCGGHSFEGLSYTADGPFVLIDLEKLNRVQVDARSGTAWVEGGATLGEIYSTIGKISDELAFPAGSCHTVGCGGHISGGGLGFLSRKYGLAADYVLDAHLIDESGIVLNKSSMGEDVFWALRGGGGGSWGIVYAWKIQLLPVARVVTAFKLFKTGADDVTETVGDWQSVAPKLEETIFMQVKVDVNERKEIRAMFYGIYLGRMKDLMNRIKRSFPVLGMEVEHCREMSWLKSVAYFEDIPVSQLTNRYYYSKPYVKVKSDFVNSPLPEDALREMWARMEEEPRVFANFSPLGGAMDRFNSRASPFPHRPGYLFYIHYGVTWSHSSETDYYLDWMRDFYDYMEPYVSSSPRAAYVNFIDLDLGIGNGSVKNAKLWGEKYFGLNFDRLVEAKTQVDPNNIFKNHQSIPPRWTPPFG
ncbi:hypothetical protein SUGI_0291690 [Cryptomeria japonica]|nr:hypothetical protein SUGI_0291690 [Cryptomeria japonica]